MPAPRLDPADLVAFARRDWAVLENADLLARSRLSADEKSRLVAALYASAKATIPGWPTDADRLLDLAHHARMRELLDRADRVGR
ncbi:MAG: hypothetical protein EXR69_09290 [Myxococcales bacterium]|nr:hypothetical protein [Myxococcales bacterium]